MTDSGQSNTSSQAISCREELADSIEIRPYRRGDEVGIVRCFNAVFPAARRSLADWNWAFRDNPAGLQSFIGILPDGTVVSQFAGIPRRVQVGAVERSFSEIVDSFVDPAFRAGLKSPGLFARTACRYIRHFCRADCEAFAYGLPTPEAYRLGRRLLGYSHLWNVDVLLRDTQPAASPDAVTLEPLAAFPGDTDALWARARRLHDVAVIRDRIYLTWRYVAKPSASYRRYALRDDRGLLAGIVVLRDDWLPGDFGARVTAVADWIVDRRHPRAHALFDAVAGLAADSGAEKVALMFTPRSPEWDLAIAAGYRPSRTKFRFVGRTYDPEILPLERAGSAWFVTLGDFDII